MSIYTPTARFDSARALTETEMRKQAPSIFAVDAHESRSERFQPIPTWDILRGLMGEGFMPVGVKQSRTRDPGKAAHTKHLIRLRRIDQDSRYSVGDTVCEILLKNANDGSSAYDIMAGLFRIRCLNSLVAQTGTLDTVKVRHSGAPEDVMGRVIEGTHRVLGEAQRALAAPADWGSITLSPEERFILAQGAHALRFGAGEDGDEPPAAAQAIKPTALLQARRVGDQERDLWTTFNVVQENVIRGGLTGITRDANNRPRRVRTREVKGIDQDVKLNRALWIITQQMAALKSAA